MTVFQLGSISTGTLLIEDIFPAYLDQLDKLSPNSPLSKEVWAYMETGALLEEHENAWGIVEQIDLLLNELCPPFVYFGALEGDGADFGFWPDMDRLNEELQWERDHYPDDSIPDALELEDYNVIVQVSDHGNVTVMDMERNVIWSAV
jgi:hypothetical protein